MSAISYERARDLVVRTLGPDWNHGTFHLDEESASENDEMYVFPVGPRELLVDGDLSYARFGGAVPVVIKHTAELLWVPEVRLIEDFETLRPIRR